MNYEETLSTLKAIQASYAPVPFLANPETEPRFVINSDTREIIIPEEFKFLAVKMDHMSEKIYFEIPRYFDNEDLATKICVVQYINANGDIPIEAIVAAVDVDTESESGKIIFRWDVDNYLTRYAGIVSFAVRFYTISDDNRFTYSWNTLPATLPVLDTLDNTNDTVSQNYPTELVQWQFRMSELDRTISDKISEATATIDADAKAALEARKGAEEAESRVSAIVSGNEAYTKQQSHDLFALALKGTAEAAKSITIYPDKGSNVVATINGFTKQEGSGDASPANVRTIVNGGVILAKMTLTGSNKNWQKSSDPRADSFYFADALIAKNSKIVCNGYENRTDKAVPSVYVDVFQQFIITPTAYGKKTLEQWKAELNENPLELYYEPSNIETGNLYTIIGANGSVYTGTVAKLTAKLCQGDKLITKVKSGFDRTITFDGSSDENWIEGQGSTSTQYQVYINIPDATPNSAFLSDVAQNLPYNANNPMPYGTINQLGNFALYLPKGKVSTVQAAKEYLSANPITIWYRSANYTEADDKPVSLEMHARAVQVLDGTESFAAYTITSGKRFGAKIGYMPKVPASSSEISPLVCNQYKSVSRNDTNNGVQGVSFFAPDTIGFYIVDDRYKGDSNADNFKANLAAQYAAGTPVVIEYDLATPIVFAHEPVDFIASPDEDGAWVITGEADGTVSAEYNKNITKALEDILTRVSALELHALGG